MDAVKEDMQIVGVRVEDTKNRVKWKTVIRCGNAWKREKQEGEEEEDFYFQAVTISLKFCLVTRERAL